MYEIVERCSQLALIMLKIFWLLLLSRIFYWSPSHSTSAQSPKVGSGQLPTMKSNINWEEWRSSFSPELKALNFRNSNFVLLFVSLRGWSHRLAGLLNLLWLIIGTFYAVSDGDGNNIDGLLPSLSWKQRVFMYDTVLGILGIITTFTAAKEFPHKYVRNATGQSGTLHSEATVTQSEMIEHSFYQFLNLWQSLFLHIISRYSIDSGLFNKNQGYDNLFRLGMLWVVTSPWLIRKQLPIHSFSHNWRVYQNQKKKQALHASKYESEILLYRVKKAQYLFYKHVILHGVNISLVVVSAHSSKMSNATLISNDNEEDRDHRAFISKDDIPYGPSWRVFWLLLNTSYVMEFFLQSLVKRSHHNQHHPKAQREAGGAVILTQSMMLLYQRLLMLSASLSAVCVVFHTNISWLICCLSVVLNIKNRHHDVFNTMAVGIVFTGLEMFG